MSPGAKNVKYLVVIEQGRKSWGAHVPDLPGCVAAARTKADVLKLIKGAIELHIEGLKDAGRRVPRPRSEAKVVDVKAA
jgi:predicted RNase H-like HicB family nuclease